MKLLTHHYRKIGEVQRADVSLLELYSAGQDKYLKDVARMNQIIFAPLFHAPYRLKDYQKRPGDPIAFYLAYSGDVPEIGTSEDKPLDTKRMVGDLVAFSRYKRQDFVASPNFPQEDRHTSWYLWLIGVKPEFRNKGIGTVIIEHCEHIAKRQRFLTVDAKVYNVSPAMQRLLIRRGYSAVKLNADSKDPAYNSVTFELQFP